MDDALLFDGLEAALLGFSDVWHPDGTVVSRAIYSGPRILEVLMDDGMADEEEALEYLEFNIAGAYAGPTTPIIVWPKEDFTVNDYVLQ